MRLARYNVVRRAALPILLFKERFTSGVAFNPLSAEFRADPYTVYRSLRERDPVHWSDLAGGWLVTRFQDVIDVLGHPLSSTYDVLVRTKLRMGLRVRDSDAAVQMTRRSLFQMDPPEHTRLRSLLARRFTTRTVDALRPRIDAMSRDLLDRLEPRGEVDLVSDFALPLSIGVIASLLGVSLDDRERFREWGHRILAAVDPTIPQATYDLADEAMAELRRYLEDTIAERRSCPQEDLISALIAVDGTEEALTTTEVCATSVLLLMAGHETSANLIATTLLLLLQHPEARASVRSGAVPLANVIEESLRFESPVQLDVRIPREDMTVGGKRIRAGQPIICALGAANRDPEHFPDPDRFDVTRETLRHLALGHGIHFCLGAPLARLEATIAVAAVLERFPHLAMEAPSPVWKSLAAVRGLERLPVALGILQGRC